MVSFVTLLPLLASLASIASAVPTNYERSAARLGQAVEQVQRDAVFAAGNSRRSPSKRLVRKRRDDGGSGCNSVSATASPSPSATQSVIGGDLLADNSTSTDGSSRWSSSHSGHSSSHGGHNSHGGKGSSSSSDWNSGSSSSDWNSGSSSSSSSGWNSDSSSSNADWSPSSTASAPSSSVTDDGNYGNSTGNPGSTGSNGWKLVEKISGANFFDSWNFWSYDDPTHGEVKYVDAGTAWNDKLVAIENGKAIMRVDTTPNTGGQPRKSVRIHGNRVWNGGMVLMDADHMPTGCGTWPAWWQNGPNWPEGGEIDILEGVNDFTQNQVSLHTGAGCTMPGDMESHQSGRLTTGNYDNHDCSSAHTQNQGCGVIDTKGSNTYGKGFNDIGGGVYALIWIKSGISVYFFPRNQIPGDIKSGNPNPDAWGTPVANFPGTSCDPLKFFRDHYNIFDTTLCGDWAGADSVWNYGGGQGQSCAASTGYSTCVDYVHNNGGAFKEAYWSVNYVTYYQQA